MKDIGYKDTDYNDSGGDYEDVTSSYGNTPDPKVERFTFFVKHVLDCDLCKVTFPNHVLRGTAPQINVARFEILRALVAQKEVLCAIGVYLFDEFKKTPNFYRTIV